MNNIFAPNESHALTAADIVKILSQDRQATAIFTSRSLHVGFVNEAMMALWSVSSSIVGQRLPDFAPQYSSYTPILEEVWDTGKLYLKTDTFADLKDQNGNLVSTPLDFVLQPVLDAEGKTIAIINSAMVVTERLKITQDLNETVTTELELNEKLSESNQRLLEVNHRLKAFNEEYSTTNEELNSANSQLASLNEELSDTLEDMARLHQQSAIANHNLNNVNEELQKNRKQLANALEAASLGSYRLDLKTMKMDCSDQCKSNFGLPVTQKFDFEDLIEAIIPDHRAMVNDLVLQSLQHNHSYNAEYQISWPDGTIQWIQANGTPHYDQENNPVAMIGVTQLITDKKNYQAKKDEFLSVASHELKTPVTVLKANLQLLDKLKSRIGDPAILKLVEASNRSMDKISGMLNELLDVGKYADGKMELNRRKFDLNELLKSSFQHLSQTDHSKIQVIASPMNIFADQNRIEQVIVNFINNAIKYAPESENIILKATASNESIRVSVQDFGKGIPEKYLPHLFDRYWQENKEQGSSQGLGLGLYICADIIKKHNGHIGVESVVGQGSIFWFEIPVSLS